MSIVSAQGLSLSYGARDIFGGINVDLPNDVKVGLVGPNGIGKTSLLRMLAGVSAPTEGSVSVERGVRLGYLRQEAVEAFAGRDHSVYDEMQTAFAHLHELAARLASLEERMAAGEHDDELLTEYGDLQERFEHGGGYDYDVRIKQVLDGLGFDESLWATSLSHLSGGQKTRALLARLLLEEPTLLILDEPTNHLDVQTVEWLETRLRQWSGALLVTSHDRYFLDRVVDRIWEMTPTHIESYRGNYSAYLRQRQERWEHNQQQVETELERLHHEMELVRRYIAWRKFDEAKGKLKRLSRDIVAIERFGLLGALAQKGVDSVHMMSVEDAYSRLKAIKSPLVRPPVLRMRLKSTSRSGGIVLRTQGLRVGYGDSALYNVGDIAVYRLDRVALIGPNGSGKTTFLRTVLGQLPPVAGEIQLGAGLKVGYFAQAHDGLDPEKTVLEELLQHRDLTPGEARSHLAQYLFRGEDVFKPIRALSGGERGRLALALLALEGVNCLLLDEPTNHLDIPAQEVLQEALDSFEGTLLMVSHDRYLVDRLATRIWELRDGQLYTFDGGYSAYVAAREEEQQRTAPAREGSLPPIKMAQTVQAAAKARGNNSVAPVAKGRAENEGAAPVASISRKNARKRGQEPPLESLERGIAEHESLLATYTTQLQAAGESGDYGETARLGQLYAAAETELERLMAEWGSLAALPS